MSQDKIVAVVAFLTPLLLEVVHDTLYIVQAEFQVSLEGKLVVIHKGFATDLASVPRIPVVYLAVGAKGHKAAVLHDYLYQYRLYTRKEADKYFYEALKISGVSKFHAYMMYLGVRVGGSRAYNTRMEES